MSQAQQPARRRALLQVWPAALLVTVWYFSQAGEIPNSLMDPKASKGVTLQKREDDIEPNASVAFKERLAPPVAREPLLVHIYGGSVSRGHGTSKPYATYLQELLEGIYYNVSIENFARPATGVGPWVDCGIETPQDGRKPDVIISEYHLNEGNHDTLRQWYDLASRSAKQVVVFDIWSWLFPPDSKCSSDQRFNTCNTYAVVLEEASKTDTTIRLHDNFSILSMIQRDMYTWQGLVPDFFSKDQISQECFEANAARNNSEESMTALKKCRQLYTTAMQHGNAYYHRHLGSALFEHFQETVLPRLNRTRDRTDTSPTTTNTAHQSRCVGSWGGGVPSSMKSWEGAIVEQHGYTIGNPHTSDPMKVTLHTNHSQSVLILDRPQRQRDTVAPRTNVTKVATIKLGFIGHSDPSEAVTFRMNNQSFSTQISSSALNQRIRVRRQLVFTGDLPVRIILEEVPPGAFLELTDVVFPTLNAEK